MFRVLTLSFPPFGGFSWNPRDVLSVVPSGLALAFMSSINLLMTSRVVEHFRGRHKHLKRSDADAEVGAYGIANLCAGVFGAPMSVGIPARGLAAVRSGGSTRMSNLLHALFLFALVGCYGMDGSLPAGLEHLGPPREDAADRRERISTDGRVRAGCECRRGGAGRMLAVPRPVPARTRDLSAAPAGT